jgi:hypothetical protein
MKISNLINLAIIIILGACTKFDDAEITERKSFVHFYSSGTSFEGAVAEVDTDGGYIIGANISQAEGNFNSLIIKTDSRGNKLWERVDSSTNLKVIKPYSGGYLALGDSIELNLNSGDVTEILNTRARLMLMDNQGNILREFNQRETITRIENKRVEVDFHGSAFTIDNSNNVLVLGSRKAPGSNEQSFIASLNPADFSINWIQSYGLTDRDYVNCNELYVTPTSKIIWACKAIRPIQNLSDQYLSIAFVEPNSTFLNNSLFGENDLRNHTAEDIKKSPLGYGVVGTYAQQNGADANIYFVRINSSGNIIEGSQKYFDGVDIVPSDRDISQTNDTGDALTSVEGGWVLAGSMNSTPEVGNGFRDIILIKLDPFGNLLWSKLIGGTGDETVSSIRETADGGLLICGTNTINGLSSIMLLKTDAQGEIKN